MFRTIRAFTRFSFTKTTFIINKTPLFVSNSLNFKQLRPITSSQIIFSKQMASGDIVDYGYVKKSIEDGDKLIIDVREPDELTQHGIIPKTINIPCTVQSALSLPDDEFKKNYKAEKPAKDKEIIFFCMSGKRSTKATNEALGLGFKNVKNYTGSFLDWKSKEKPQ